MRTGIWILMVVLFVLYVAGTALKAKWESEDGE